MSSDESISRQINTALELVKAQGEFQQDKTHSNIATREKKQEINSMDMASLKIKALRRATIRRKGSSFDNEQLDPIQQIKEVDEDSDHLQIHEDNTEELVTSFNNSDASSTVNHSIITKNDPSHFKSMEHQEDKDESYKLNEIEKKNIREETQSHINSVIKQAKGRVRKNHAYYMTKYGKPENLIVRRKISRSTMESPRVMNGFQSSSVSRLKHTYYDNHTSSLQEASKLRVKKPSELLTTIPAFQTSTGFYNVTPQSYDLVSLDQNPETVTSHKWTKTLKQAKSISTNFSISDNKKIGQRSQGFNSGLSSIRNFNSRKGSIFRSKQLRSVTSASSLAQTQTPTASHLNVKGQTSYQNYKDSKKNKRGIFTNQMVPSKNKIIPTGRIREYVDKVKRTLIITTPERNQIHKES
jgi:hypothetical protein